MINVQLKIVEEGLKHPISELKKHLTLELFEDDILVRTTAELTLKIKFYHEFDQDLILIKLRETATQIKISEKVIPYKENSWIQDICAESQALLSPIKQTA
jgi:hypothetical protein